jgi:predicted O-linked N-acetylglucosamine transferase (SPINDLY family)
MRLLNAVEGSVLWLPKSNDTAMRNLKREAEARGVAPERLVFAPLLPGAEDHLARLRLADLFLDTLPCNAHTTASDALFAGVPLLTCTGNSFASRVAASLLKAAGVSETIVESLTAYEALALQLGREPAVLAGLRDKLARQCESGSLFDTARFTRHLEAAYLAMWQRAEAGLPPADFTVQ